MHWVLGAAIALCGLSCSKLREAQAGEHAPAAATAEPHGSAAPSAGPSAPAAPVHGAPAVSADAHAPTDHGPKRYGMPFAWEVSRDEPLAKTRNFLTEVFADNALNVERGAKAFRAFRDAQAPRATVVTCADSRVQSEAWDATPENDDFVIRNIGNQIGNAHGSVEYGIEHLHTPLLLIIGHTGCGAVKAVLEPPAAPLSPPIKKELAGIVLPPADPNGAHDPWAQAVIANVNSQVAYAVEHFGAFIQRGELTVVGAVYDFRNDLGEKAGKLHVVNVNANVDRERLTAFQRALQSGIAERLAPAGGESTNDTLEFFRQQAGPARAHRH